MIWFRDFGFREVLDTANAQLSIAPVWKNQRDFVCVCVCEREREREREIMIVA